MIFLSCLLTICINQHSSIKDDNHLISYIYKDQQECLDKNKGKSEFPNDNIKYMCENIVYPPTNNKIDPIETIVVPKHIETEGDKAMKKANEYYKNHINEYEELHKKAIIEKENTRKQEEYIREKEERRKKYGDNQSNDTLNECINRNSTNINLWALSNSKKGDANDYNRKINEAYSNIKINCMGNKLWNGFYFLH